jgi:hypothetical protein
MFIDAFIKCSQREMTDVLARLDQHLPHHSFRLQGLMMLKKKLGFYPDAFYLDLTQADQHPTPHLGVVYGPQERFLICRGDAPALMAFNQSYPLTLDRHLVLDYIRFYFAHITGPYGRSYLIDVVEDLQLKEEPTPALRRALHDKIVPLSLNASLAEGGYQARASLLVTQTLYSVFINVTFDGAVRVELGRVLADLLPVNDRALEG